MCAIMSTLISVVVIVVDLFKYSALVFHTTVTHIEQKATVNFPTQIIHTQSCWFYANIFDAFNANVQVNTNNN